MMSTERVHQVGRFMAGRIASKREELSVLRERVEQARRDLAAHPGQQNEYRLARAEVDLEDFEAANPGLVS